MKILGIDPGNTGAIACLSENVSIVYPMPIIIEKKGKKIKTKLNLKEITAIINTLKPNLCYIEQVSAMPGQGVTSMFNFGKGYGSLQGILAGLDVETIEVRPQKWKKQILGEKTGKESAIAKAKELFPYLSLKPTPKSRKDSDGMAEALLIAYYGISLVKIR